MKGAVILKEDYYILNLEACDLVNNTFEVKQSNRDRLYVGMYKYNLESDKLQSLSKAFCYDKRLGKYITNVLANINFTYSGEHLSCKKLRDYLYENGFDIVINGEKKHFVRYKRSASKARIGSCLFILDELLEKMRDWSRIHIDFSEDEELSDLAGLLAYESLSLSEILKNEDICLRPRNILIIDKKKLDYLDNVTLIRQDKGTKEVFCKDEDDYLLENNIWDGQGLIDKRLCGSYSSVLLRQRFFKCNCLSTNLQQFFLDNNVHEVVDMFGNVRKTKDIRLIITPDCLKLFKFSYKFHSEKETFSYWLNSLKEMNYKFGIVKHELASKMGVYNQLSYQFLNSLFLTDEEIDELLQEEIEYINLLKNNSDAFRLHLSQSSDISLSNDFIMNMLNANPDFENTDIFKQFKKQTIHNYKRKKLYRGKIHVQGDYCVMFSNVLNMLYSSIGKEYNTVSGKYVYCSRYKNGENLLLLRNPHVCSSNFYIATNEYNSELTKYFNLNSNIVIVNSKSNIMDRLSGCDFDGDTALVTNNRTLISAAQRLKDYRTILLDIPASKKVRRNTPSEISDLDFCTSQNKIGQIVNESQILNSYMSEFLLYNKDISDIYQNIAISNILSMTEIDKAKKTYDIPTQRLLDNMRNLDFREVIECDGKARKIRPQFFKFAQPDSQALYAYRSFNCTMDRIIRKLQRESKQPYKKTMPIEDILNISEISPADTPAISLAESIIKKFSIKRFKLKNDRSIDKYEEFSLISRETDMAIKDLKSLELTPEEIMEIIYRCYNLDKQNRTWYIRNRLVIQSTVFTAYEKEYLKCIKSFSCGENREIKEVSEGQPYSFKVWGRFYQYIDQE